MKKSFSLAAASVLLLASFSSCQFSDSAEDTFVSIVCTTAQASEITIDSASLNGTVQLSNAKAEQAEALPNLYEYKTKRLFSYKPLTDKAAKLATEQLG